MDFSKTWQEYSSVVLTGRAHAVSKSNLLGKSDSYYITCTVVSRGSSTPLHAEIDSELARE